MITGKFPSLRLRRSRKNSWSRRLIEENNLSPNDFILPLFLIDGKNKKQAIKSIKDSNQILSKILRSKKVVYGVNTGFGKLSHVKIDPSKLKQLQLNLIRSHATGVGKPFDHSITRLTMTLKLMTWSKGYSGVRPKLVTLLLKMINHD